MQYYLVETPINTSSFTTNIPTHSQPILLMTLTIAVVVDPSIEIDDEIALLFMLQGMLKSSKDEHIDLITVFSGPNKMSDQESMDHWLYHFSHSVHNAPWITVTYLTLQDFAHMECTVDYGLLCASLKKNSLLLLTVRNKFFLQGDSHLDGTKKQGLNSIGSEELIERMAIEGKLVEISSDACVCMRPTREFLSLLPSVFKDAVVFMAFKLFFGRMDPTLSIAMNMAPGLVNPAIGRGANWNSVSSLMGTFGIDLASDFGPGGKHHDKVMYTRARMIAIEYFKQVFAVPDIEDVKIDWHQDETVYNLTCINLALEYIVPGIWDGCTIPIFSDKHFTLSTLTPHLKNAFRRFYKSLDQLDRATPVGFLNPLYDLFAAFVACSYIQKDGQMDIQDVLHIEPVCFFQMLKTKF